MKNKVTLLLLVVMLIVSLGIHVAADTQEFYSPGSGWKYLEGFGKGHMGTKSFTYKIDNPEGQSFSDVALNHITNLQSAISRDYTKTK